MIGYFFDLVTGRITQQRVPYSQFPELHDTHGFVAYKKGEPTVNRFEQQVDLDTYDSENKTAELIPLVRQLDELKAEAETTLAQQKEVDLAAASAVGLKSSALGAEHTYKNFNDRDINMLQAKAGRGQPLRIMCYAGNGQLVQIEHTPEQVAQLAVDAELAFEAIMADVNTTLFAVRKASTIGEFNEAMGVE